MPDAALIVRKIAELERLAWSFADLARSAALSCDEERARRLADRARRLIADAEALNGAPIDLRGEISAELQTKLRQDTSRALNLLRERLNLTLDLLAFCPRGTQEYPFKKGCGSFVGTKAGLSDGPADGFKNRINFKFRLTRRDCCERICLVTVLHREFLENGLICNPPSTGSDRPPPDPFDAFIENLPLDDDDAEGGYIVDTKPLKKAAGKLVVNTDPCFDAQQMKPLPKLDPANPAKELPGETVPGVEGTDKPGDFKLGTAVFFETAAICVVPEPWTVLQTMRWKLFRDKERNFVVEVLPKDGSIDWGASSGPFQKALKKWMKNHRP